MVCGIAPLFSLLISVIVNTQKQYNDYDSKRSAISGAHNLSENKSSLGLKFRMLALTAKVSVCVCVWRKFDRTLFDKFLSHWSMKKGVSRPLKEILGAFFSA